MKRLMKKVLFFVLMITCMTVFAGSTFAKTKIALNSRKVAMTTGDKTTLRLIGAKAKKIKWSSSNKKVAAVNRKGIVTAKKTGKAVITAKYGKKKYKAKITVIKATANANRYSKNASSTAAGSSSVKTVNEFYNPNNFIMADNCINIMPYHIYYKDNCLFAECYIINGYFSRVYNIDVRELSLFSGNRKIAGGSFGIIAGGAAIGARSYGTYTFIFDPGYYKPGAALNTRISCVYSCYNR